MFLSVSVNSQEVYYVGVCLLLQIAVYFVQIAASSKIYINILLQDLYITSQ